MREKAKYFREIFYFSTLILIFGILTYGFFGHVGNVLVDCGREAYIPEKILEGKVLYKDVFILYGPFSYQINALLYKIFGIHLNTLYFAGVANSFLILSVYYWISRRLTSIKTSWLVCFLLMTVCMFYYHITGYIFPYSYGVVYALSAFLISVLFCLYYIEKSSPLFLIMAAFFMGISAASKLDFIGFSIVLALIALYFKPLDTKNLVYFTLAYFFVPVICWGIVFINGLEAGELLNYLEMMREFVNSHLFKYFYQEHTGLYPTHKFLWGLSKVARIFAFNFSICILGFYGFFLAFAKLPEFRGKGFIQTVGFIALYILFPKDFFKAIGNTTSLGWIAVGTAVILALFLVFILIENKMNFKKLPEIRLKDKFFILIALAGILSALKSFFFINLHVFGTYFVPLLILASVVFLFDKLPQYIKILHEKAWKQACFTVLFLLGIIYILSSLNFAHMVYDYPLKTHRGKIYTTDYWGAALDKLMSYIDREIPTGNRFVMMPEGLMINFLKDRDANDWFYSLTPNFVEAFEDKIIQDIQLKSPEYIFITNQDTNDYGFRTFGEDYGKNIYNYVKNNYNFLQKIEEPYSGQAIPLKIKIYRIKP